MKLLMLCLQLVWSVLAFLRTALILFFLTFTPYLGHVYLAVMLVAGGSLALPGPGPALAYRTLWVGLWIYFPAAVFTSFCVMTFGYLACSCKLYYGLWEHLKQRSVGNCADIILSGVCWPISWVIIDKGVSEDYKACWMDMIAAMTDYWLIGRYKGFKMRVINPVNHQTVTFRARNADDVDRIMAEAMTSAINAESPEVRAAPPV